MYLDGQDHVGCGRYTWYGNTALKFKRPVRRHVASGDTDGVEESPERYIYLFFK